MRVFRSGVVANRAFTFTGTSRVELDLHLINTDGSTSVLANLDSVSYLSGSTFQRLYLSSADQCLYCLLQAGTTYQLLKVNDTTGVVTTIGSSFTPATPSNWSLGSVMYQDGAGHLLVISRGKYHQLNKTTGAIVSQDVPMVLGTYTTAHLNYLSSDGTTGISRISTTGVNVGDIWLEGFTSTTTGNFPYVNLRNVDALTLSGGSSGFLKDWVFVDSDKIYLGDLWGNNTSNFGYIYRSDFDEFLQSVVDWFSGV